MNQITQTALILSLPLLLLSGCTAVVIGGAAAGGYYLGKDSRSVEQIATDAKITASVKTALLRNDTIHAWQINVDTFENVVVLHGSVGNRTEYKLAEEIAASVKDVRSVDSRLEIVDVENDQKSI
jgi:hyperosmotically inducible protein